jgi:polysaccharide export outer membrane protein
MLTWAGLAQVTPAAPAPAAAAAADPDSADRKIAAQDILSIVIVGEVNLPPDYPVSGSGSIQFPYLGMVSVKGLTPRELGKELERQLSVDYFVAPEVLVNVKQYRQEYVRVIGQVNRPGPIPLPAEQKMDILDAIAIAGGTTRLAKDQVEFTRDGKKETYTMEKLKRVSDPAKRIYLQPGDLIEVREGMF